MSPFFIEDFRRQNPCRQCKNKPMRGKKFCEPHLVKARVWVRIWSQKRRAAGLCLNCTKTSDGVSGRCPKHRKINTNRANAWYRRPGMKEYKARYSVERKMEFRQKGLCFCFKKNPLLPGFVRCLECRVKSRFHRQA